MGKALVDPIKAQAKEVDALRKMNKDRMDALRADFLAPRVAYDAEVLAHKQYIASTIDDLTFGNRKVGEFKVRPSLDDWSARIDHLESMDVSPEIFGDRSDEVAALRVTALGQAEQARDVWIEEEAALEAGRKALKIQQDAEAAQRHAAREKETKEVIKDTVEKAGGTQKAIDAIAQAEVHNDIIKALVANEVCSVAAGKALITAIYKGKIPNLSINY